MADVQITKLPSKLSQLPWPVWVGASLLIHAGALAVGLPTILRVDPPSSNSVDIPITLVDEGSTPVAAPEPPPPPPETTDTPLQTPNPIGGQNPTIAPQETNQTIAQQKPQQETAPQKPETQVTPSERQVTKPTNQVDPTQEVETPDEINIPEDIITPDTSPVTDTPAVPAEEAQSSEPETGTGAISISIVGTPTVAAGTPGDWPDILPVLQNTSSLSLTNHTCNDALPAGEVTLGLVIRADGSISDVFAPPDEDSMTAQIASCLITHALSLNPAAIQFKPAYTGQQAVMTDRIQLTVRFSAG
ncbi:MAG: hypothetical protein KTR27_00745 [Leptolyngbyaceae cyanobacterium MAG.088]|nr:hypothetical protein [Leptolyngbyaceae cyanobacterium MAG.088]